MTTISSQSTESIVLKITAGHSLQQRVLYLGLDGFVLRIRSNSSELLERLADYFSHVLVPAQESHVEVLAIESQALDLGVEFIDWKREPGKTGRKDSYIDLEDGRLVRKVRTGMIFLQSEQHLIATGPCLDYSNQVINFINSQYMNWLQNHGWLICHASGLVFDGRCLGMAGYSGGGKSTLMLHLLEQENMSYMTNDRLFIKREKDEVMARGIPKLPRINPGTIVHNPRLHDLIPANQRKALLQLPPRELWHLEDKYDVKIDHSFGQGKITSQAPMSAFLILNWSHDTDEDTRLETIDLSERRELLSAIMKSSGPFYQYLDGSFQSDEEKPEEQAYLNALEGVTIYEACGQVDFQKLTLLCQDRIFSRTE